LNNWTTNDRLLGTTALTVDAAAVYCNHDNDDEDTQLNDLQPWLCVK